MINESSGTYTHHPISHYVADMTNDELVATEDGKFQYWREALPIPLYTRVGLLFMRQGYECQCGRRFDSHAAYELHYRKAYIEEKTLANQKVVKK